MGIYSLLPKILDMSVTASIVICFVLLIRLFIKKAPKIFSYVLWAAVLFRLLCPVSFSSSLSFLQLFPVTVAGWESSLQGVEKENSVAITSPGSFAVIDESEMDKKGTAIREEGILSAQDSVKQRIKAATWLWLFGIAVMMTYSLYSLLRLRKMLIGKVCLKDHIYQSDYISFPFVMGIFCPEIYLPSGLSVEEKKYIILHEQIHIKRKDPIFRLLAYMALMLHWFNPLVWAAFFLSGRDMEMSCDEAVMKKVKEDIRAEYSASLLSLSSGKRRIMAIPPAFGEGSVKSRIKNVMHYRKPMPWLIWLFAVIVAAVSVCLSVNPKEKQEEAMIQKWADAFCDRNGEVIFSMSSPKLRTSLEKQGMMTTGGKDFGWSSPWPWDKETDYRIGRMTDTEADILYYAQVSDPHVTVWKETITYHVEGSRCIIDTDNLLFLDNLCVAEEFYEAYPGGIINDTPMDYLHNGAGEALNKNAKENRNSEFYAPLFEPETAACYLLNISNNKNKVEISADVQEQGRAKVTFHFAENNSYAYVSMIQPFGEDGIWIPQTFSA